MHKVKLFSEDRLHRPPRMRPYAKMKHCAVFLWCLAGSHAYDLPGNGIHSQRNQGYIPANNFVRTTAKSKGRTAKWYSVESYDFDMWCTSAYRPGMHEAHRRQDAPENERYPWGQWFGGRCARADATLVGAV